MATHMAASSREGKKLNDSVFWAGQAAQQAIAQYGEQAVVNATVGCYAGEDGELGCLPTVEALYRTLPIDDFITYAPPIGLPEYRQAAIAETFEDQRPDGYADAVATAGGTGAVHIAITNYSEVGDTVLTTDWRWGIYGGLCQEVGRKLAAFSLFDEERHFNLPAFAAAMTDILSRQDSLLLILNTPANNPTGFAMSEDDWDGVLQICREQEAKGKRITILVDIAYIAYAGEKNAVRQFMKKFSNLPPHILILFAFSMSKGYTLYGQRAGALVALSSSRDVIDEFVELGRYSARTSWSNVNRAAMTLLVKVRQDPKLQRQVDAERQAFFDVIWKRADLFMQEAAQCGLRIVPYHGGFFISIPTDDAPAVCRRLQERRIFAAPLAQGVRLGVCSVPLHQIQGLALKIKEAIEDM